MLPKTPFSTRLSGSTKEMELRLRNILQWKKQRPPVWAMVLTALVILFCGNLVSCNPKQTDKATDVSTGEKIAEVSCGQDRTFYLTVEDAPEDVEALSEQVGVLYYSAPDFGTERIAVLDYGPDNSDWDTVSLTAFSKVLGYSGVVFSYQSGAAWACHNYYALDGDTPFLMAPCYNNVWQEDVNDDGTLELLSNYSVYGVLDVYDRSDGGLVVRTQLNETAYAAMPDVPDGAWVSFSGGDGTPLTASWKTESGTEQTRTVENMPDIYSASVTCAMDGFAPDGTRSGAFFWQLGDGYGLISVYYQPDNGQPQQLLTLDYSSYHAVTIAPVEQEYPSSLPTVSLNAFTDVLGQSGVVCSYYAGGRQVQHFFCVSETGQATALALCDADYQVRDLDGDGIRELWSVSQDGQFCYFYHVDPAAGSQPLSAFVCGQSAPVPDAFSGFARVLATGDGTLVFTDDSGVVQASFTPETLLDYITQHDAWSDHIPSWADGGRIGNLENFIESSPPTLAQRLAEWAQERLDDSSPSLDLTDSTATEAYRQEKNGLVFLLVDLRLRTHPSGLHHLILGVYDPQTDEFSQDVYDVGGDDGLYALWQEGDDLYVFCANSVTYQGIETSTNPLFLHWDGQTLEPIFNLPAAAYQSGPLSPDDPQSDIILYGEMDNDEIVRLAYDFWFTHKAVPVVGGFDLYESSPNWMSYSDEQPSQWNYLGRVALTDAVLDASTSSTNVLPERTF